ncbi:MAG TPA: hypothetical protein VIE66_09305, partial [Methylocella sp.]
QQYQTREHRRLSMIMRKECIAENGGCPRHKVTEGQEDGKMKRLILVAAFIICTLTAADDAHSLRWHHWHHCDCSCDDCGDYDDDD